MASQSDVVEKAVGEALKQIEENAPEEFKKLNADPKLKAKVIQAAKETATETLNLTDEFRGQSTEDIAKALSKHLSEDRIKLIKGGLEIPTFRLTISKQGNGQHLLEFSRDGKEFQPSRAVASVEDIDWGNIQQYASILVEAVLLVMSAVGISVSPSGKAVREAVDDAADAIRSSSKLQNAMEDFVESWNAQGASAYDKAKAIFTLIKESNSAGILWTTIKALCSDMSWLDWMETSAKVTAMIVAALATDGAALIAEIALVVLDAVDFARKIANIVQLSEIKKTM